MTDAERQQRRRQRLRDSRPVAKPAAQAEEIKVLQQQLAQAVDKITALEREVIGLKLQLAAVDTPSEEVLALRREVISLRRQLAQARAAGKPKPPATLSEEVAALQRQLKGKLTRIRNLEAEVSRLVLKGTPAMVRSDRMGIVKCLHPDQVHPEIKKVFKQHPELARQHLTACQAFNALFETRKVREI